MIRPEDVLRRMSHARTCMTVVVLLAVATVAGVSLVRCGSQRFTVGSEPTREQVELIPVRTGSIEGVIIPGRFSDADSALERAGAMGTSWTPRPEDVTAFERGLGEFLHSQYGAIFPTPDAADQHRRQYSGECSPSTDLLYRHHFPEAAQRQARCKLDAFLMCDPPENWRTTVVAHSDGEPCFFHVFLFLDAPAYGAMLPYPPSRSEQP